MANHNGHEDKEINIYNTYVEPPYIPLVKGRREGNLNAYLSPSPADERSVFLPSQTGWNLFTDSAGIEGLGSLFI